MVGFLTALLLDVLGEDHRIFSSVSGLIIVHAAILTQRAQILPLAPSLSALLF